MKWIKRVILAVVGLVALVLLGLTAFFVTFDANDYRPQLVKLVKDQTGRELSLDGDLELILFSWRPGLSLAELRLSNAPGFGEAPFAELRSAQVELEWLPLLRNRELKVVRIELTGLRLRLARNAQGVGNWEDLAGSGQAPTEVAPTPRQPAPDDSGGGAAPLAALTLGELRIADAQVQWRDEQAGTQAEISRFDLTSGRVRLAEPFPLKFNLQLASSQPQVQAQLAFSGMVTADPAAQRYSIADLDLGLDASGAMLPVAVQGASLRTNLDIDLAAERLRVAQLRLAALGVSLSGEAEVTAFASTPAFSASLALAPFSPRDLLTRLQMPVPETADPAVLSSLALDLTLAGTPAAVKVEPFSLRLDQSTLQGRVSAAGLDTRPAIRFELALDTLDADRYLPPPPPEPPAEAGAEPPPVAQDEPLPIPVQLLRDQDVEGRVTAGSLKIKQARLEEVELGLRARDGRISLEPLTVNLYEGILRGSLGVDATQDAPQVAAKFKLAGVESEPLLNDVLDLDLVRGKADADIDLTTGGIRVSEFKANLNGRIAAAFADGAVKGFNLAALLREAEARLEKRSVDEAKTGRATDFAAMSISADVVNGVLKTRDLDIRAPLLRVTGVGEVNLNTERLDYLAQVTLTDKQTGQGGVGTDQLKGLTVPVRVRGPFAEPKVSIELAKALEGRAREQLQKQAAEAERQLQQRIDAEKARLQSDADAEKARAERRLEAEKARLAEQKAAAEAELKAQADAEKKRAEDKLKQNLENQLKGLFQ